MNIKVTCPQDSWPNRPTTKVLPDLASAQKWAEWGHCCVRGDLHSYVETDEPVSEESIKEMAGAD